MGTHVHYTRHLLTYRLARAAPTHNTQPVSWTSIGKSGQKRRGALGGHQLPAMAPLQAFDQNVASMTRPEETTPSSSMPSLCLCFCKACKGPPPVRRRREQTFLPSFISHPWALLALLESEPRLIIEAAGSGSKGSFGNLNFPTEHHSALPPITCQREKVLTQAGSAKSVHLNHDLGR